jgi:hypothetical protein
MRQRNPDRGLVAGEDARIETIKSLKYRLKIFPA